MTDLTEDQKFEQVARKINPESKLLRTWQLMGGLSAWMTAFEVRLSDGQTKKLIVRRPNESTLRRNPRAASDEFKLLQTLHSAGLATQTPYYLDQSGEIFATPYFVMEYVEGNSEYAPANLTNFVFQVATQLARIHQVDGATLPSLPKRAKGYAGRPGNLSAEGVRICEALQAIGDVPQVNQSVLLHGDFWAGNILWKDGRLAAVIDWEDATVGDPLADFAVSRFDMRFIFGSQAMEDFTRHYQAMNPVDFTTLPYWDLCAALRAAPNLVAWTEGYPSLGRTDITDVTMGDALHSFVSQALEKLG